ncbi:hypothetical protein ISP15_08470 [Dyella jejuensis]|uniref:Uncharacterized protein n=1 Tax=Dyella jejuensis TaxID=1432009 RepID=A0ABW8JKJ4_9GAMM
MAAVQAGSDWHEKTIASSRLYRAFAGAFQPARKLSAKDRSELRKLTEATEPKDR